MRNLILRKDNKHRGVPTGLKDLPGFNQDDVTKWAPLIVKVRREAPALFAVLQMAMHG